MHIMFQLVVISTVTFYLKRTDKIRNIKLDGIDEISIIYYMVDAIYGAISPGKYHF